MFASQKTVDQNDIELHLMGDSKNELKPTLQEKPSAKIPEPPTKYNKLGIYLALLSIIFTVVGAVIWKWNPNLPRFELLTTRSIIGCLISYYLIRRNDSQSSLQGLFQSYNILIGACGAFSIMTYSISLLGLSVSEVTIIYATLGIFNGVFGLVFLKEPYPTSERLLGLLSFIGVAIIVRPSFIFGEDPTQDKSLDNAPISRFMAALLCLISTACWSVMQILLRGAQTRFSGFAAIFQKNICMGIICGAYLLLKGGWQPLGFEGYFTAFLLSANNVFLTYAIIKALEYEKASVIGLVTYTEIVFAILADVIVFRNFPSLMTMIGISLIMGSCLFLVKKSS